MPDFTSALKEEVRRLARRESKRCLAMINRVIAAHRREIAGLKRRLVLLAQQPGLSRAAATNGRAGDSAKTDRVDGYRFSPKGMRSHRKRLDLSADQFGRLLGVSAQSVYAWETGRARPRAKPLAALVALRAMGKREVFERLAMLEGNGDGPAAISVED